MNSTPADAPVTSSTKAAIGAPAQAGPAETNRARIVSRADFTVQSPAPSLNGRLPRKAAGIRDGDHQSTAFDALQKHSYFQ
jgi:hypothetical protein